MSEAFVGNLLLMLFCAPLLAACLTAVLPSRYASFIFMLNFVVHATCLLILPFLGDINLMTPASFLGHPISFTVSTTGATLALLSTTALFLLLITDANQAVWNMTRGQAVLIESAMAAGCLAFFSGQFMLRYIALEFVGLTIAASLLTSWETRFQSFIDIFTQLRFGDLCLLLSILFLAVRAGTLDIALMIKTATQLPLTEQLWLTAGFLTAVLVKNAVYPFDSWWVRFEPENSAPLYWIGAILLPTLGSYLLIRVAPILHADPILQYSAAGIALLLMGIIHLAPQSRARGFLHRANGLLGCFTLLFAAFLPYISLREYTIAVLAFRVFTMLQPQFSLPAGKIISRSVLVLINGLLFFFLSDEIPGFFVLGWVILSAVFIVWVLRQPIEPQPFPQYTRPVYRYFTHTITNWMQAVVEQKILNNGFNILVQGFSLSSRWLHNTLEAGFDRAWDRSGEALMRLSHTTLREEEKSQQRLYARVRAWLGGMQRFENWRTKIPAHWNLVWIPIILVVILVFLLFNERSSHGF